MMQNCEAGKVSLESHFAESPTHLLNLLELVDTEDTENVTTRRAGLLAEAGRVAGVLDRELLGRLLEPLVGVHGRDGLLRRRDEVLLRVLVRALELRRNIVSGAQNGRRQELTLYSASSNSSSCAVLPIIALFMKKGGWTFLYSLLRKKSRP